MPLSIWDKLQMVHRCWRLRFKSEVDSIQYVRSTKFAGATVIYIGAKKGAFSIYMSRAAGSDGQFIAFEAQPELGERLTSVKISFSLDNMTLVNQGPSSEPGVLTMRRPEAGSRIASFHKEAGIGLDKVDIPVIRLDEYARANGWCGRLLVHNHLCRIILLSFFRAFSSTYKVTNHSATVRNVPVRIAHHSIFILN